MENKLYSGLTIFPKPYSCCEANRGGSGDTGSSASLVLGLYQTGLTVFPKPYICCEANKKADFVDDGWLFKDKQFDTGVSRTDLPALDPNTSYTMFVNGVECDKGRWQDNHRNMDFYADGVGPEGGYLWWSEIDGAWEWDARLDGEASVRISIRIND